MKFPASANLTTFLLGTVVMLNACNTSPQVDHQEKEETNVATLQAPSTPLDEDNAPLGRSVATAAAETMAVREVPQKVRLAKVMQPQPPSRADGAEPRYPPMLTAQFQRESYNALKENSFITTANDPLSTFSIDVDSASYANLRRYLTGGKLPPVGAVRIEEMINYFSYSYPEPGGNPIAISTELGPCPWQPENRLVRIGLKAKDIDQGTLPPSNLVFLIDASGSMNQPNKLPLLKQSMSMLVEQLSQRDRVAIVVYAGSDRVVLPPTPGDRKEKIEEALRSLSSGGSTHASSGIRTAYELARQTYMPSGNNRIILASDGDFNVGVTSRGELERLVKKERESGVFLTVLGFGMGNYHDDTMEILADKGNGNYGYIDSLLEAKKMLVKERASTFFTLGRDVKLQIEFNPMQVGGYRLIGYENRLLADEDFNNDQKDAGEIGAGHTVTALYELLPPESSAIAGVDQLKYQSLVPSGKHNGELLNIKLRYKPAGSDQSRILSRVVRNSTSTLQEASDDFRFTAAVAGFGMLLRRSDSGGQLELPELIELARSGRGADQQGYRAECIRLLEIAELLSKRHLPRLEVTNKTADSPVPARPF